MTPQQFIDKWNIDRTAFGELLNLGTAQTSRLFFPVTAKNHQMPTEVLLARLGELDLILENRSQLAAINLDPRLKRIFRIVPEVKTN